ncbi:MAG: hypothetical protein Q7S21_07025 [archaeon]|nr:hypothetical protein [archaeon]
MPSKKKSVVVGFKHGLPVPHNLIGKEYEGFIKPEKVLRRIVGNKKNIKRYTERKKRYEDALRNYNTTRSVGNTIDLLDSITDFRRAIRVLHASYELQGKQKFAETMEHILIELNETENPIKRYAKETINYYSKYFEESEKSFREFEKTFNEKKSDLHASVLLMLLRQFRQSAVARLLEAKFNGDRKQFKKMKQLIQELSDTEKSLNKILES